LRGLVSGIVAVLLFGPGGGAKAAPTISLFQVIGHHLLIVASILVLRGALGHLQEPVEGRAAFTG